MNDKPPSPRRRRITLALACAPGWAGLNAVAGCQAPARLHADARTRTPGSGFTAVAERLLMAGLDRSPEASISAGRYAVASQVTLPDATNRAADLAFAEAGLAELAGFDIAHLTPAERIDHGLLKNRYEATRWQLLTLRDWAWNPARYNVAPPISLLLNTPYAPEAERLRTVSARLAQVPAYYAGARSSVEDPTAEHRELAQTQARGTLALLGPGLQARVAASALASAEQAEFAARLAAARQAIHTWQDWLSQLQPTRTFRLGPELYEQKFRYDVQSSLSARELYERAAAEKERLHADMDARARELWPRYLASQTMPQDRLQRIGRMVADCRSALGHI